jgi:hypothetical protein
MKTRTSRGFRFILWFFLIPIFVLILPNNGFAASTTTIFRQIGSGAATASGDYIGSNLGAGLDLTYRYYIEVPAGVGNLTVEIYDADTGAVANYTDWQIGGAYNTSCRYTLNRPNGTNAAAVTYNNTQTAADSVWTQLYTVASPAEGHWELIVDMSSAITAGDDVNGYGIRAHDGTPGAGGTELPIYAHSFVPLGVIGLNPASMTTTLYPYVTSGCTVDWNDFDGDDSGGAYCQLSYASRAGAIATTTYNGAANDVWLNRAITGFRTDLQNMDSGIWTATARYTTLSGSTANFGVFWAGNWLAATGAPNAQPQANSFRVYLPTDGGGAPAKPYLTQKVLYVSGTNPPHHGTPHTASYLRIIITFNNPAARAVTFSNSNLVTANVPGGKILYRGSAYAGVSQGSITAQPVIGGSGNVTWNPGTVAAGTQATLYYEIGVTPTVNNERLILTGTPASNGTTARYVDETGNITQARATYTFGPLCELAATEDGTTIPTWVAVSCFEACAEESQPTVEWHTASEVGTVGFNLWRQDKESKEFELVNPAFMPALPNSPQGGIYRLADPGAQSGEPVVYRLEEIDASGQTMMYGPFTVTFGASSWMGERETQLENKGKEELSDIYGYQRFHREQSVYETERLKARQLERQRGSTLAASISKERVRITVKGRGLFYVTSAQVAGSLGISMLQAEALIRVHQLNLTCLGKNIAWLADRNDAGIFFYSHRLETPFSDWNVFWLEQGSGLAMEAAGSGSAGPADSGQVFWETLHFEENRFAASALFHSPKDDIWLWDYVEGGGAAKSFPMFVPGARSSGRATLSVSLKGATDTAAVNDHHASVSLNGTQIGDTWWDGTKEQTVEFTFNSSLLNAGANTVSISGALDMGAPYSSFYVESFDLKYQREYAAVNNVLLCRVDNNPVITVTGLTDPQVVVLDISNTDQPRLLAGIAPDVSGRVTFVPRSGSNSYLVSSLNASLRPISVVGDRPAQLKGASHSAEYIVIAPEEFKRTAQELADYRQGRGLKSLVVTLEDIYEVFNYGVPSPLAIRDFLAHAYAKWGGKKVKYAVLAGKGTYDYRDYLGYGDNLVPVILSRTPEGLFAADKEFGDVTGKNGLPEIAIGRLPAVTNAELQSLIDKIKSYESSQGAWTETALMIADNTDNAGDFATGSNSLAGLAAGYRAEKIYLADPAQAADVRARIVAAFHSGAALANYCGHAGLFQLAQENIFDVAAAAALDNGDQLPLMVMLTCVAGRFEIPGFTSLAEALLLNEHGGIAGGLAPTGAGLHSQSLRLGEEFYRAAFGGSGMNIGAAWVKALKNYLQQGGLPYMLNIYNWLGDPATTFK